MVLVCLPFDALSQHLPSYLGFSYLGLGVSLHGCSSKVQLLLLTLEDGYLLTAAIMWCNMMQYRINVKNSKILFQKTKEDKKPSNLTHQVRNIKL